jgi:hypothetical protein
MAAQDAALLRRLGHVAFKSFCHFCQCQSLT